MGNRDLLLEAMALASVLFFGSVKRHFALRSVRNQKQNSAVERTSRRVRR